MKTGIKAAEAMTEKPVTLTSDVSLGEAAAVMDREHVGSILVTEDDKVTGIVTEQDIVRKLVAKGDNPLERTLGEVMETNLITANPDMDVFDAVMLMRDKNIRHLPVVESEKFVGLLTLKDVLIIQPQLFDLMVEKFEVREESKKLVNKPQGKEGLCHECGEIANELHDKDEARVCINCR